MQRNIKMDTALSAACTGLGAWGTPPSCPPVRAQRYFCVVVLPRHGRGAPPQHALMKAATETSHDQPRGSAGLESSKSKMRFKFKEETLLQDRTPLGGAPLTLLI